MMTSFRIRFYRRYLAGVAAAVLPLGTRASAVLVDLTG
jgi:hypothetical protein